MAGHDASIALPDAENGRLPTFANPKRTSSALSKSLPLSKKQKLVHTHDTGTAGTLDAVANLSQVKNQGSGSDESALLWFEKANTNVPQSYMRGCNDEDEPPFFITGQNNPGDEHSDATTTDEQYGGACHDDSENQDLRAVIDDLTVENKRLKHLLKGRRNRPTVARDAEDKLFEIRMHGLPTHQRRELEQFLKNFATNINQSAISTSTSSATRGPTSQASRLSPISNVLPQVKHAAIDSGYGSNSSFTSITASRGASNPVIPLSRGSRNKHIKTHLHDIPDALLPRQPMFLSEREKMALVVRRLEQLFTGKLASPGEDSQSVQQQEVSQSAARADRQEDALQNRKRKVEGSREAHILPYDSKINLEAWHRKAESPHHPGINGNTSSDGPSLFKNGSLSADISRPPSPDQRPTRPLDLDIHRAQVAEENIEYIRHLGVSSPHLDPVAVGEDSSWIYLNLLTSMAQLHTINVTPAFVRKALGKMSSKFELSSDGNSVRWLGSSEATQVAKDEERELETSNKASIYCVEDAERSSSKRSTTQNSLEAVNSGAGPENTISSMQINNEPHLSRPLHPRSTSKESPPTNRSWSSAFNYRPIVFTGKSRRTEASCLDSSSSYACASRDSSGLVHALEKSNLNLKHEEPDGTITFFNNPFFYSDISAEKAPVNWKSARPALPWETVGISHEQDLGESPLRHHDACYFVPQYAPRPYRPRVGEETITFSPAPISSSGEDETLPIELPASGIGGITPEENFALDVKVAQVAPASNGYSIPFTGTRKPFRYSFRTQNCDRIDLRPSPLPPPTFISYTSASSSGNPDILDSDTSDVSFFADEESLAPSAFLNHWSTGTSSDGGIDGDSDDEESSVDILTTAKAMNPKTVAAWERQYLN